MKTEKLLRKTSGALGVFIALAGAAVLAGWALDIQTLKSVLPGFISMKANTALCFVLTGVSLWLSQERYSGSRVPRLAARLAALAVFAAGTLVFFEYLTGRDFGIDQLLFTEPAGALLTTFPGRMAFNTSIVFMMISAALFLLGVENAFRHYPAQLLFAAAGGIPFLALVAYLFGATPLYFGAHFNTAMALHTTVLFLLVCAAGLFARPDEALMKHISDDGPGGATIRRLLPVVMLAPVLFGWLKVHSDRAGLLPNDVGIAIVAVLNVLVIGFFVYLLSVRLNRLDAARKDTEARLRAQKEFLEDLLEAMPIPVFYKDPSGVYTGCNAAFSAYLGHPKEKIIGSTVYDIAPAGLAKVYHEADLELMRRGEKQVYEASVKAAGGAPRDVIFYKAPLAGQDGSSAGLIGAILDVTERKSLESKLSRINECFLKLGGDFEENISRLTALCGGLLGADFALYHRLEEGILCPLGEWNMPEGPGPAAGGDTEGLICYDLLRKSPGEIMIVRGLESSAYARTDPNVAHYGLKTYLGWAVRHGGRAAGALCAVYRRDFEPTEYDKKIMGIIAAAVATEEARRLADKDTRFKAELLDEANDLIYVMDSEKRLVYANETAARMAGRPGAELIGGGLEAFKSREAAALVISRLERITGAGCIRLDVGNLRKDGTEYPVESYICARDIGGKRFYVGVDRDMSERRLSEMKLAASEKRYRSLYSSSRDALMLLAPEKGFFDGNPSTLEMFRCKTVEELSALTPADLSPEFQPDGEPSAEKARRMIGMAMEKGSHFFDWRHKRADGEEFPATVLLTRTELDGKTVLQATVRDITELKKAEDAVRNTQKLESIGLLAGGIAHDFNNMLAGIIGNLSLLKHKTGGVPEICDLLAETESAAGKAHALSTRLLTFAKGGEPVKKMVDPGRVLRETVTFAARGSNCRLSVETEAGLPPVLADENQLGQVLTNMVRNAIQAMPGGGEIGASAGIRVLGADSGLPLASGKYVVLSVSDTGAGIPADTLGRIFEPYFTTKSGGHGLGLSIAHSVIKKHDGHIAVRSSPSGSEFFIYLPAASGKIPAECVPAAGPEAGSGRVLVMEDDAIVQKSVSRMLGALGYDCSVVGDGAEAIEVYGREAAAGLPFDMVIMDLTIPGGMGGKEAVGRLKQAYPSAMVLVSSGYSDDQVMSDYKAYGFDAALAKPYKLEELSRALSSLKKGR